MTSNTATTDDTEPTRRPMLSSSTVTSDEADPEPAAQINHRASGEPIAWLAQQLVWEAQLDRLRGKRC